MTGEKPFPDGLGSVFEYFCRFQMSFGFQGKFNFVEKSDPKKKGGAIYISIPSVEGGGDCWNYLGFVSNEETDFNLQQKF